MTHVAFAVLATVRPNSAVMGAAFRFLVPAPGRLYLQSCRRLPAPSLGLGGAEGTQPPGRGLTVRGRRYVRCTRNPPQKCRRRSNQGAAFSYAAVSVVVTSAPAAALRRRSRRCLAAPRGSGPVTG